MKRKKPVYIRREAFQAKLQEKLPLLESITVTEDVKNRVIKVQAQLPWWKWFGLGLVHVYFRHELEKVLFRTAHAGVLCHIDLV